jgi:two-component system cell cycle response regulator CtrA
MMRVLLIEGDPVSAELIDAALQSEGMICRRAETGERGIHLAKTCDFDAIILDVRLPDMAGWEVVRRLRTAKVRTPVLPLLGMGGTVEEIRGLAIGPEDYLTKPFQKGELIARIHAIMRRSKGRSDSVIRTAKLEVNLDARSVDIDGRRLHVTSKEYSILELLSLLKGRTLTKEMLLDHLYGGIDEPELKIIDVFIAKLCKKIAAATGGQHYIETVWGEGYVLKDPDDRPATHPVVFERVLERETLEALDTLNKKHKSVVSKLDLSSQHRRLFFAHAREDKQRVRQLYAALKKCGFNPWLDEVDLLPGQN